MQGAVFASNQISNIYFSMQPFQRDATGEHNNVLVLLTC